MRLLVHIGSFARITPAGLTFKAGAVRSDEGSLFANGAVGDIYMAVLPLTGGDGGLLPVGEFVDDLVMIPDISHVVSLGASAGAKGSYGQGFIEAPAHQVDGVDILFYQGASG